MLEFVQCGRCVSNSRFANERDQEEPRYLITYSITIMKLTSFTVDRIKKNRHGLAYLSSGNIDLNKVPYNYPSVWNFINRIYPLYHGVKDTSETIYTALIS